MIGVKNHTGSTVNMLALISWFLIVLLLVIMILLGLPKWFAVLRQVCYGSSVECQGLLQLSPVQAAAWPSMDLYAWYNVLTRGLARLFSFALGVLILVKKPGSRIAWVTSIYLIVGTESGIMTALAKSNAAWLAPSQILQLIGGFSLVLFAMLFPNDYFAPRWTRWLIIPWILISTANNFIPHDSTMGEVFGMMVLLMILLLVGTILYRYNQVLNPVDRQKARWVIFAFAMGFGLFITGISISIAIYGFESPVMSPGMWILQDFLIIGVSDFMIPAAIAISILRYQLFDIDVIIRKTLVYAGLTGVLVLVYFGLVTLLQNAFGYISNQQSPIAIVLSTLAIAALFNPFRRRIQELIDRRFYRRKYDAELALSDFAFAVRDEVELEKLTKKLLGVVKETVQPEKLSLWVISSDRTKHQRSDR